MKKFTRWVNQGAILFAAAVFVYILGGQVLSGQQLLGFSTRENLSPTLGKTKQLSGTVANRGLSVRGLDDNIENMLQQKREEFNTGDSQKEEKKERYVKGEVIVKYRENKLDLGSKAGVATLENIANSKSITIEKKLAKSNVALFKINDNKSVEDKITELKKDSRVEFAQPNFRYYTTAIPTNDTYRSNLWGLDNTGQTVNGLSGTSDADIDAPEAWSLGAGDNNDVIVAVIDTGVAYNHPDLIGNMWDGSSCKDQNGADLGGCNYGYDFADNDKTPLPPYSDHGTHIAGIIAATKNNGKGVMGVSQNASIMAIRSDLTTANNVAGIEFAAENGAKIINASWGDPFIDGAYVHVALDQALYDAIDSFDGLFIAAAGNSTQDHDSGNPNTMMYPAGYRVASAIGPGLDNIISVAATDQDDNLAVFSDYGALSVDVGAPGTSIYSTVNLSTQIAEDFDNVAPPALPTSWSKTGYFGTYDLDGPFGKVLYGDYSAVPYRPNANYLATLPGKNMSNSLKASVSFVTACDTEYSYGDWYDYMALEVTSNGTTYNELVRWDESIIDTWNGDPVDDTGSAIYGFEGISIPAQYLTSNFRMRFRWVTDSSNFPVGNYDGCFIDYLSLIRTSNGADERYNYMNGTSMAAPYVSGLAAQVMSYNSELTIEQVRDAVVNSGDSVASLAATTITGRRINARSALEAAEPANRITSFELVAPMVSGAIDEDNNTIAITVPYGTDVTALIPLISTSVGATVNPDTGVPQDFSLPVVYQVLGTDLTTQDYTVTVTVAPRSLSRQLMYKSGTGAYDIAKFKLTASGDFNFDGRTDVAGMYDYGNKTIGLWTYEDTGAGYKRRLLYKSGTGAFDITKFKFMSTGDTNNDGHEDLVGMYNFGNNTIGLWAFEDSPTGYHRRLIYKSSTGAFDITKFKFMANGDYNNNFLDDFVGMYNYGNNTIGLWAFEMQNPLGTSFARRLIYKSGTGAFDITKFKFMVSGDFNSDGSSDVAAMYNYGANTVGLWTFENTGVSYARRLLYKSGTGAFDITKFKFMVPGDFNNDGLTDIAAMYNYGNNTIGIWAFENTGGGSYARRRVYLSGTGAFDITKFKFMVPGDFNNDGMTDMSAMYNYGNNTIGFWAFK
jgi:subtilisin family serine protease